MPYLKRTALCVLLATNMTIIRAQAAQQNPDNPPQAASLADQDNVIHVAGLEEVRANAKGDLKLRPDALTFTNSDVNASIPRKRIVNVFIGDQRTEPWGTTGAIARKVIPFGGGAALGAATSKKVDLLTVEYRDTHDAYHGVVFVLPVQKATAVRDQILANLAPVVEHPLSSCTEVAPRSVLVAPITASGIDLPAEYRILLYEHLIKQLRIKYPAGKFLRVGDRSAGPGCVASTLHIAVTDFKKGNRAVRASTGPLGLFLGTTSLTFDIKLEDAHGKPVFQTHVKKSNRSDSDSLGLANGIAKNVAKRFDKAIESSE